MTQTPQSLGEAKAHLAKLLARIEEASTRYIGFPNALDMEDNVELAPFLRYPINNIGDPYIPNAGLNTCLEEQQVLAFCMQLLGLHDPGDRWGYVGNGSTEANQYGIMLGRDTYPDGILLFSEDAHYSLPKIAHILKMDAVKVATQTCGEVDYAALRAALIQHCIPDERPPIICCNVGTTMKGAIDKPEKILALCDELGIKERHIHCDAALHGLMLPLLDGAPVADFRLPIGSMSFSGHKFPGSPIPSGVVLTKISIICETQQLRWRRENNAEYVGSIDTTIAGSRDGIAVLMLWLQLFKFGVEGLRKRARECMEMTALAKSLLLEVDIPCYHHPYSNILVFPQPSTRNLARWMIAAQGETLSHIVLMPGTGPEKIEQFVDEIQKDRGLRSNCRAFHVPPHLE